MNFEEMYPGSYRVLQPMVKSVVDNMRKTDPELKNVTPEMIDMAIRSIMEHGIEDMLDRYDDDDMDDAMTVMAPRRGGRHRRRRPFLNDYLQFLLLQEIIGGGCPGGRCGQPYPFSPYMRPY